MVTSVLAHDSDPTIVGCCYSQQLTTHSYVGQNTTLQAINGVDSHHSGLHMLLNKSGVPS